MTPLSLHVEPGEPFDLNVYAFRIGQSYRRHLEWKASVEKWAAEGGLTRASDAFLAAFPPKTPDAIPQPPAAPDTRPQICSYSGVIGGGDSLAGKIRWLIENEEPRTSKQLADRLGAGVHVSNVSSAASLLFRRGSIGRSGRFYTKISEVAA